MTENLFLELSFIEFLNDIIFGAANIIPKSTTSLLGRGRNIDVKGVVLLHGW